MMRFSVHQMDERLLNGNGALQHLFDGNVVGAITDAADVHDMRAFGNQRIDAGRIIPYDAFAGRLDPTGKTADAPGNRTTGQIDGYHICILYRQCDRMIAQQ